MQGSLAHAGHVGARNPDAQVKVLFHGPAVILVGHWIRGGEGLAQIKGMVWHQAPEASWMGPQCCRYVQWY